MHKSVYNEATVKLAIRPVGPILIKAGGDNADPSRPDMSFVRTSRDGRETVYLPGSSLKGVIRAHCERLARTIGTDLACDPLRDSCGDRLKKMEDNGGRELSGAQKHKLSCPLCRLFGNTRLASHFRIEDGYPEVSPATEERNGVAIDRVFGSVAGGALFNYETVAEGSFRTTLRIKNFTLAQLGLLSLALRDLAQERVRLGFAKSRGLGLVTGTVEALTLSYPLCSLEDDRLSLLGRGEPLPGARMAYGVGAFVRSGSGEDDDYGYPAATEDAVELPEGYTYQPDELLGVNVHAPPAGDGSADWQSLGRRCVERWRREVTDGRPG